MSQCENLDGQCGASWCNCDDVRKRAGSFAAPPLLGACVEFIKAKLAKAEMTLATREAMEKCWREGTDESWRAAGCHMSKSKRMEASARHGRIAVKNREEVAMFKAVLHQLAPNIKAEPCGSAETSQRS